MTNTRSLLSSTALSGALAVSALVVAAGAAQAATVTFNGGNAVTLATQSLNSSGTIALTAINVPVIVTGAVGESCANGAVITLTAPTGTLFSAAPLATFTGANAADLSATGVVQTGSSTVNYTLNAANGNTFASGSVMTIGANTAGGINLTSGTTFASPVTTARPFTVGALSCASFTGGNTGAGGLASASGVSAANAPGNNVTVDTTATGAGKLFATSATNSTRVAALGTLTVSNAAGTVNAGNGSAFTLPAGSALTVTASGPFSAASRVYLATGTTCTTTAGAALPAGNILGTVSGGTATFASAAVNQAYVLCYENNGTSLITAGSGNTPATFTGTAVVSTLTGSTTGLTLGNMFYSGTASTLNYVTGGSAYQYFVRVTNPTAAATSVFAVVTRDDGTTFSGSVNTNLGANSNALYSIADLNTATGANLTANDRARVQILTSANPAPVVGLLFNTATGVIAPAN